MFEDRGEAGRLLVQVVQPLLRDKKALVMGILRGGIVVAAALAQELSLPLDVVVVKKIPSPLNPEYGIGAVGEDKIVYWEESALRRLEIDNETKQHLVDETYDLVARREMQLSTKFHRKSVKGKTVFVVDDGIATGATVTCAVQVLQNHGAKKIVVVTPVTAEDTYEELQRKGINVVSLVVSSNFQSVGQFYVDFPQVTDEEVMDILKELA